MTQGGEAVVSRRTAQGVGGLGMQFSGSEGSLGGDVGETEQSVHECELPGVVELQAGNALAVGQQGGLAELVELAAVDESF